MKKQLILYVVLLAPLLLIGQSDKYIIFPADFEINCISVDSSYQRFTPSDSEINYADSLAKAYILNESSSLKRNREPISSFDEYKKTVFWS